LGHDLNQRGLLQPVDRLNHARLRPTKIDAQIGARGLDAACV
jgi:hypothetical protein